MKSAFSLSLVFSLYLTGCNLYGGLSKPGNDAQYLVAARACLDRGDYQCAKEYYQALSNAYNDIKVSEDALTVLAEYQIFSISDLVGSLGTNLGSAASFSFLAQGMARKGVLDGSIRTIIKQVYDSDADIQDAKLKAFSKFLASIAMFNQVLGNAVGADGQLTASDIVDSAKLSTCRAESSTVCGLDSINATCSAPAGTALVYTSDSSSMTATTAPGNVWSGPATIQKLVAAAAEAAAEISIFTGKPASESDGILSAIQQISSQVGSQGEACARKYLIQYLGL